MIVVDWNNLKMININKEDKKDYATIGIVGLSSSIEYIDIYKQDLISLINNLSIFIDNPIENVLVYHIDGIPHQSINYISASCNIYSNKTYISILDKYMIQRSYCIEYSIYDLRSIFHNLVDFITQEVI